MSQLIDNPIQNREEISVKFADLLNFNATVNYSLYFHKLGLLSEVEVLKLAILIQAQQIEDLENQIGKLMLNR